MRKTILLGLLFAIPALANDGDPYFGSDFYDTFGAYYLCDSKNAVGPCVRDMAPPVGFSNGRIVFEIVEDIGCASCSIEIRAGGAGKRHLYKTLACSSSTVPSLFELPSGYGLIGGVTANVLASDSCGKLSAVVHWGGK